MLKFQRLPHPTWPDEREAVLRQLWADGLSASKVAAKLNARADNLPEVTRNSVIGKISRLGLPARMTNRSVRPARKVRPPVQTPTRIVKRKSRLADILPVEPPIPPADYDVARISFADLETHHCKWICTETALGPNDKQFCGCDRAPGQPYCVQHAMRAYSVPTGIPSPHFTGIRSRFTGALVKRLTNSVNLLEDA